MQICSFFFYQKTLVLKQLDEHPALRFMYKKQPDILRAITDGISDIHEENNVSQILSYFSQQ